MEKYEIINYNDEEKTIEVRIDYEHQTGWLSSKNIALLFNKDVSLVRKYAKEMMKNETYGLESRQAKFASLLTNGRQIDLTYYDLKTVCFLDSKFGTNKGKKLKEFIDSYIEEIDDESGQIIIYNNGRVTLDVRISPYEKTVWLSEKQISDLFGTTRQNINLHVQNIIKDNELDPISVSKDYLHTAPDGKCYVIKLFNLDMILAVGYRVRSAIAINFRRWASDVLSAYLLKGVVVDEQRCLTCQNEILKLRNDINEIKLNQRQEIMYFKGESLRGFIEIKRFLETAKKEIIIIDNYFSKDFDEVLKNINVRKIVITNNNNEKVQESSFYELYKCNDFHGRYIFVDDVCYHSDPSFKDIGNHDDLVTKLNEPSYVEHIKNVVQTITNRR